MLNYILANQQTRGVVMFFLYVIFTSISGQMDNLNLDTQMRSTSFPAESPEELHYFITRQIGLWSTELHREKGKFFFPSSPAIVKL